MQSIEVKTTIRKDIPEEQIKQFEDRLVYFTAILTREYTKGERAYPYKKGNLYREEVSAPVKKIDNASYGLVAGVDYAKYVYKMTDVKWTNTSTQPQWYSTIYRQREKIIIETAQERALKELEK